MRGVLVGVSRRSATKLWPMLFDRTHLPAPLSQEQRRRGLKSVARWTWHSAHYFDWLCAIVFNANRRGINGTIQLSIKLSRLSLMVNNSPPIIAS